MEATPLSRGYKDYFTGQVGSLPQLKQGNAASLRNVAPGSNVSLNKPEDLPETKSLARRSAYGSFSSDFIEETFRKYSRNPHSIYLINLITSLLNHRGHLPPGVAFDDLSENFKKIS
ncbi:MAG: hypothetical protein LBF42_02410 [Puniceicoccales bacterium]|jgi:hypothetical protein|nr:hypothetical protein [Puniceicoccales bacterium]